MKKTIKIIAALLLSIASVTTLTGCHSSSQITGCKVEPMNVVTSREFVRYNGHTELRTYSTKNGRGYVSGLPLD